MRISGVAVVGALVAIVGLVTAAVLFTTGDQSLERLAVLVAVVASIVPGLLGALRADQAATNTNGSLDGRIADAVQHALKLRRHTDAAVVTAEPAADPPAERRA